MKIENIIYETTRGIYSIEDKLSIGTIFIFCWKLSSKLFSELLYTDNHEEFVSKLNSLYKNYDVDFSIRLHDKNVRDCFFKTLEKVKEIYDANGFFKALHEEDEFAVVVNEITNHKNLKVL